MRILLLTVLGLAYSTVAVANFDGSILTFSQLKRLPRAQRLQYVNELRKLLVELGQQEDGFLVSENEKSAAAISRQVALLARSIALLPEAQAESEGAGDTNEVAEPGESNSPAAGLAPIDSLVVANDPSCKAPVSECPSPSQARHSQAVKEFLKDTSADANVCIAGGFFSKYASNVKKPGTCHVLRQYPESSGTPSFKCGPGTALCNPMLYCAIVDDGSAQKLDYHCEPFGGKAGTNLTERCEKWYDGVARLAQQGSTQLCDPANTKSLGENWDQVRAALKAKYQNRCISQSGTNPGLQELFCRECESMGRIFAMNFEAFGSGCAPASGETPAAPSATPDLPVKPVAKTTVAPSAATAPVAANQAPTEAAEKKVLQHTCLRCHGAGAGTPLNFDNLKGMKLVFGANATHVKGKLGSKGWADLNKFLNAP